MIMYALATENDLDNLVAFLEDPSIDGTFVKPLSDRPITIRERVYKKFKDGYWILAKEGENLLGCLALIPNKDEIEISTYAVSEKARGKGIGTGLIYESEKVTLERYPSVQTLILDSWSGNPAIERIMDKTGFGLRDSFPDPDKRPPGINTVVYAKKVR